MRAAFIRRSAVAACSVSVALLVTACGVGKSDSAEGGAKSKASAPDELDAKVLTTDELEKAVLADGEVEGYKVTKPGPTDITQKATADRAACTPLAEISSGLAQGEPVATVQRKVLQEPAKEPSEGATKSSDEDKKLSDMTEEELDKALQEFEDSFTSALNRTATLVSLDTYDGKGATETLTAIKTSASACADGYTVDADGEKTKVTKVEKLTVSGGQEAVGWSLTAETGDMAMPVKVAIVRQGSTLAAFVSFNLTSAVTGGKDFPLPTAVIDVQVDKLAKQS